MKQEEEVVEPNLITLKIVDQRDRRIFHTMGMSDKFQGLIDKYYSKTPDVTYGTGTFLFDGCFRVVGWKTPADLEMKDGDEIDFFECSIGGGLGC